MNKKKNKVWIIGGNGFLGKEVTKVLIKNFYDVKIIDLPSTKENSFDKKFFVECDIFDIKAIDKLKIDSGDILVNLASRQYHNQVPFLKKNKWFEDVNYSAALMLLEKAIKHNCAGYVYFSSDMVYGLPNTLPVLENSKLDPLAEYGFSKMKAEKKLREIAKGKLPLTIFRPRLINGPGRLGVFKILFKLIKKSLPVPIIGDGNNCYQMVSVFDCALAVFLLLEKGVQENIFNLGSKKIITVNNLLKELIKDANSNSILLHLNPGLTKTTLHFFNLIGLPILYPEQFLIADKNIILDIKKSKNILKWEPQYDDSLMIKESYKYWSENSI